MFWTGANVVSERITASECHDLAKVSFNLKFKLNIKISQKFSYWPYVESDFGYFEYKLKVTNLILGVEEAALDMGQPARQRL